MAQKVILLKSKEYWYIVWSGIPFFLKEKKITDYSFNILAPYKSVSKEQ